MHKVAIVDDIALVREAFSVIFTKIGLTVLFQAGDGKELQTCLEEAALLPDIVFMDIDLPVINGIKSTAYLTKNYPSVKVIGLSIYCNEKHIIDMLKNGAKGYLTKKTDKEEMLLAVNSVMNEEIFIPQRILQEWKIPSDYLKPGNKKRYKTQLLNDREYEFLAYCATDLGYKEIADLMGIQYKTIDNYRASVTKKLEIHTRAGLATYAVKNCLTIKT